MNPVKLDKAPFGRGKYSAVTNVTHRQWDDSFEVDFADGTSILELHAAIRKANRNAPSAGIARVELDHEFHHGFFVHYDNGQVAEVSWAFVRERAPA